MHAAPTLTALTILCHCRRPGKAELVAANRVIDRLVRQWRILEALQSRRRGVTAAQLEDVLGVSHATLYRDLKILVESPLPIVKESVNGETRYRLDPAAWPKLPPKPSFVAALLVARELLRPLDGTTIAREINGYLQSVRHGGQATALGVAPAAGPHRPECAAQLEHALQERRRCRVLYQSARDLKPRWRTVEPAAMRVHDDALYVAAWDVDAQDWRIYKASRLQAVEVCAEPASSHPPFDDAEVFAHSAGVWSAHAVDVAILIDAGKARFVYEYPLVEGQQVLAQPDGAVVVRARVAGLTEALVWTMGWGRHAEALEPPELRAAIASELASAAERYGHRLSHAS